jgi:hypothetical protein
MTEFLEILERFSFLTTTPALAGLFITGGIIVLTEDRRISLISMLAQYILVGLILMRLILPQLAIVKILIGLLVCQVLSISARRIGFPREGRGFFFRLFSLLLVGLTIHELHKRYPLPGMPSYLGLACYWLASMGFLTMNLTNEPLRAGIGLLTFVTGFELFYAPLERSLSVIGLLGIANLLVALAIAYLISFQSAKRERE